MGTNDPFTFKFLKILKISHFYVLKNYDIKYVKRYIQE
jgi:hypothetical protein